MIVSENAQELLEQFWIALEEEKKPGLESASTPHEAFFDELQQLGLIEQKGNLCILTDSGHTEAAGAIRRHRLGERLVTDLLRVGDGLMEEQACRLEHALIDGLDDSICTLLGHPAFCPHGKAIPAGECCREHRETVSRLIAPLNELSPGQGGQIAYLRMDHPARLQKLMAMGVLPGGKITLERSSPSYVFQSGYSQFAVDEDIASDIFVRLSSR